MVVKRKTNGKKTKSKLRNNEYYYIQDTFDELYHKSKEGKILKNLMLIICSQNNILLA